MNALTQCPVCAGHVFKEAVPEQAIRDEILFRDRFVRSRFQRNPDPTEVKDLLDFMHGFPAPVLECSGCGLLLRNEPQARAAGDYEEDYNDPDLMRQVYPRYVSAFRKKEPGFRDLLPPGAEVLEIGSHLGAFLQVAEEWTWKPTGLDVGRDTTEFMKANGLRVHRQALEDASLPRSTYDAVFLWNCFEQIPEPLPVLLSLRRVMRPGALLVLRVPNATHYRLARERKLPGERGTERKSLAFNNLLGFPYLYGYTVQTLNEVARRAGFLPLKGFNSELITTPFPELPRNLLREQRNISSQIEAWSSRTTRQLSTFTGPWIEVAYRQEPEAFSPVPDAPQIQNLDLNTPFLSRAA